MGVRVAECLADSWLAGSLPPARFWHAPEQEPNNTDRHLQQLLLSGVARQGKAAPPSATHPLALTSCTLAPACTVTRMRCLSTEMILSSSAKLTIPFSEKAMPLGESPDPTHRSFWPAGRGAGVGVWGLREGARGERGRLPWVSQQAGCCLA